MINTEANYLVCGDCLEVMKEIPDGSVDMILCDLPYGTTGSKWDSVLPMERLWMHYKRIVKDSGAIVLFGTEPFCTDVRYSARDLYKYDWIWKKNTCTGFAHAKNKPLRDYENVMVFSKGACNHKGKSVCRMEYNPQGLKPYGKRVKQRERYSGVLHTRSFAGTGDYVQSFTGYPKSVLEFNKESEDSRFHINAKPVLLLEYLIKTYTNEGETVLDNCMGSGSTCVACVNTNRQYIGIEKEPEYYEIAKQRVAEAIKKHEQI